MRCMLWHLMNLRANKTFRLGQNIKDCLMFDYVCGLSLLSNMRYAKAYTNVTNIKESGQVKVIFVLFITTCIMPLYNALYLCDYF